MFRMLVLQALHNLSDEQVEFQVRTWFTRFCGLASRTAFRTRRRVAVPREARQGRVDRAAVRPLRPAPRRQRQSRGRACRRQRRRCRSSAIARRERNRAGETPAAGEEASQTREKDRDARWTKKTADESLGYKNHVERGCQAQADPASRGDRCGSARRASSWTGCRTRTTRRRTCSRDSAYRSAETETKLKAQGSQKPRFHIPQPRAVTDFRVRQAGGEPEEPGSRSRRAHVFGTQQTSRVADGAKRIGHHRARAKIGSQNLVYKHRPPGDAWRRLAAAEAGAAAAAAPKPAVAQAK